MTTWDIFYLCTLYSVHSHLISFFLLRTTQNSWHSYLSSLLYRLRSAAYIIVSLSVKLTYYSTISVCDYFVTKQLNQFSSSSQCYDAWNISKHIYLYYVLFNWIIYNSTRNYSHNINRNGQEQSVIFKLICIWPRR